jgi:uncharacterized protein (TIGR02444 family)
MTDFWDWALGVYAKPGVSEACLDLQDNYQQCTAYLLWAAWAGDQGLLLAPDTLALGLDLAQAWEADVLHPLRQARRRLKAQWAAMPDAGREALREQVKATELFAEQTLIEALAKLAKTAARSSDQTPLEALVQAASLWSPPAPIHALASLSQRL